MPDQEEYEPVFRPLFNLHDAVTPTRWLIRDFLELGAVGALYGPSGSLKSFVALDMALCVATGRPYSGHKVRRASVLHLASEGQRGLSKRVLAWEKCHGALTESEHKRLLRLNVHEEDSKVDLFGDFVPNLREAIEEDGSRIRFVVIDTLAKSLGGKEETNEAFSEAIANLETHLCKPLGVTVLLVHHNGKDPTKGMRGGSAIGGGVDFAFECVAVKANGYDHRPSDGIVDFDYRTESIRVQCRKQKDDEKIEPAWFRAERIKLADDTDEDGVVLGEITSLALVKDKALKPSKEFSEEEAEDIRKRYEAGETLTSLANSIGGKRELTLARVRKVLGIEKKPKN